MRMGRRKKKYNIEQLQRDNQLLRSQLVQVKQELTNRICHERKIRGEEEKRIIAIIMRQFSETLQLVNPKLEMLDLVRAYRGEVDLQHHDAGGASGDCHNDLYKDGSINWVDDYDYDDASEGSSTDISNELEEQKFTKFDRQMKVTKCKQSNNNSIRGGSKKRQSRQGGQEILMQLIATIIIFATVATFFIYCF